MSLSTGTRLGPYEVVSLLGSGGMGEVYRAHDARLGRDVAIKVLPAAFSTDVDRLQRFEKEARAAAALNHPNILAVYDVGQIDAAPYIVAELLEGRTLRERLESGPIAPRKAIEYALQVARGLSAAHEKGIVHRDLKPDNVFVTSDGRVKILDFGLAKLTQDGASGAGASDLATLSSTRPGSVLGTVGYMAPEQVRGLTVDHRVDLFAFGIILYELLSGRRAFLRDTAPEAMTAILKEEPPDLRTAAVGVPPALVGIVNHCLEKNPSERFQTANDLAFALSTVSDPSSSALPATRAVRRSFRSASWLGWAAAALLVVMLAPLAYQHLREQPAALSPMRFQIPPTVEFGGPGNFAVSPDGRHLAFFGQGSDGIPRLWIRSMDSLDVRPLAGSETAPVSPGPFWSPDGRFVAFTDAAGRLKKLDTAGGLPQTLADLPGVAVGGSWNRTGDLIVGNTSGGVLRVRETGGALTAVTALDPSGKEEFHLLPSFLPDGRHFVYLRVSPGRPDASGVYVGTLDTKPEQQSARRLLPYFVGLTFVPSTDAAAGWLLYLRAGTLMAQAFDTKQLELAGDPVAVVEQVGSFRDGGFFSASATNMLVYRAAAADAQLTWYDRQGNPSGHATEPAAFRSVALSPDNTRAVASRTNQQDAAKADLWLLDLSRGSAATRLTFGNGVAEYPIWSRDGQRITFTFNNNTLRQMSASGAGEEREVLRSNTANLVVANDYTPDGRSLLYSGFVPSRNGVANQDLSVMSPDRDTKPVPFARTEFNERDGRFSPNGRWVAYVSDQSGVNEIYVRQVASDFTSGSASAGGSVVVSHGGGAAPRWRADGRELFYVAPTGKMMAMDVNADQEFRAGMPAVLFQPPAGSTVSDATADGKRFLLVTPSGAGASVFTAVLNWTTILKK